MARERKPTDSLDTLYKRSIERRQKSFNLFNPIALVTMFLVLGLSVWYLYNRFQDKPAGEIIIIEADDQEIKIKPADPGGMTVENMDKAIYDSIAGKQNNTQEEIVILPPAEEPLDKNTIIIEESIAIPEEEEQLQEESRQQDSLNQQVITKSVDKNLINKQTETIKTNPPQDKVIKKEEIKTFKVQIASFKTKSDIEKEWKHLSKKFPKLVGIYKHYIVVKESPSKGTFYKLQIGPFETDKDALKACKNLKEVNISCFIIKP